MNFLTDASPEELPYFLSRFIQIVEFDKLRRRLIHLQERSEDIAWRAFSFERLGMEMALAHTLNYKRVTGRFPDILKSPDHYRIFSFMATVVKIYDRLSQMGKTRLRGELKKALDQEDGFNSLAFEMRIATQLIRSGFDLTFSDLEGLSRYDFLASKKDKILEIECKFISPDIGRKIHQRKFHQLAEAIKPALDAAIATSNVGGVLVDIRLPDRLNVQVEEVAKLRDAVTQALLANENTQTATFSVARRNFNISMSPLRHGKHYPHLLTEMKDFVETKLEVSNPHIMIRGELRRNAAVIISVSSRKSDTVLDSIHSKALRSAADQLTGKNTGIVCMHFSALTEREIQELSAIPSGLTGIIYKTLKNRPHIHGVTLMTSGTVQSSKSPIILAPEITTETGKVITFLNPANVEHEDDIFSSIFRDG
jgi:hypothetical protein